jgi:hypothetical protein
MEKLRRNVLFKQTIQKYNKKPIYGFDIETTNKNKDFLCASIVPAEDSSGGMFFENRRDVIDELKNKKYENSYIVATNLGFDFFGTFHKEPEAAQFRLLWRGSDILSAKTFLRNGEFHISPAVEGKKYKVFKSMTFIDTMNYAPLGVTKLGKLIGIPKLKAPEWLIPSVGCNIQPRGPETDAEQQELFLYNQNDALISAKALQFFFDTFEQLGATAKTTIAATAMSLFKNKYLTRQHWRQPVWLLTEQLQGYYGGRCEAFSRGWFGQGADNVKYYLGDVNSLYPSVMMKEYPVPDKYRISTENTTRYIENFDGMSHVELDCPMMQYPLLPYRHNTKLMFPVGTWSGWYVNAELRKATQLGYTIKAVRKSIYYTENYFPFADYVQDLYNKRLAYQAEGSPMELVVKLFLNGLYGKFAQKWLDRAEWQHHSAVTYKQIQDAKTVERVGDYFAINKGFSEPAAFTIPIWAAHVTAYGRMALHDYMLTTQPLYCDTDSVITSKPFESSRSLGKLKLVMPVDRGIIVRPKFYALQTNDEDYVKIKGLGTRVVWDDFVKLMTNPEIKYERFMRFRESLRRGFIPNEIIQQPKKFGLEDEKRDWLGNGFMFGCFQDSQPIQMVDGESLSDYKSATRLHDKLVAIEKQREIASVLFDRASVGKDISDEEFLDNEIWFARHDL